ncbi:MAG: HAMP domain-containing sensor histidine kinase [Phycisphaerales bacterium]
MWRGLSLANKCLLLFGGAVVLIVLAALSVPWLRMNALVDQGQLELSRHLVDAWERFDDAPGPMPAPRRYGDPITHAGIQATRLTVDQAEATAAEGEDPFLARAVRAFRADPAELDIQTAEWTGIMREYRYARPIRAGPGAELTGVILLQRRAVEAAQLLAVNTAYLLAAGAAVLALAVLVFYVITHKIVLSPVRDLKRTAERIREGDMATRSEIRTGDEFQELSETFNAMLSELLRHQDQLRAINSALDVKLDELAQANSALNEASRLKGEFLASVSHELRTPLNSIIGFAELMREGAVAEQEAGDDSTRLQKRVRYLDNIIGAGKNLLELINSLLEMARIEAGKAVLKPAPVDIRESCRGLLGLVAPLADRKGIELTLEAGDDLPTVETDIKLLQQVLFNLLSNAIKFTPAAAPAGGPSGWRGRVTLRAERLPVRGPDGSDGEQVRLSVIDNGPGIAPEDQARLFQKFQQLDAGHTREHAGTGLGLAISKDLATILQGEIQLVSEAGRGSMFSLILPIRMDPQRLAEAPTPGPGAETGAEEPAAA